METEKNDFLTKVSGVIHVGANTGQERFLYKQNGVATVWIEPLFDVFKTLETNLESFKHLKPYFAYNYLVTDVDDKEYAFHVTSNYGESSSIFDLNLHKEIWPNVTHHHDRNIKSITLTSLVEKENIDLRLFDALVIDTQGSELLVLKGAEKILNQFSYIQTEAADFESYTGCCQLKDITAYLSLHNFQSIHEDNCMTKEGIGSYYEVVYKNMAK